MTVLVIAVLAFALVATVLALCREVRLRKALERLLQIVLSRWKNHASKIKPTDYDSMDRTVDSDGGL